MLKEIKMETIIDTILNLMINYSSIKIIAILLMIIGTLYVSLILLRGFIYSIVKITKTEKDNKIVDKIYNFIDTYSLSFEKLKNYSKLKEK